MAAIQRADDLRYKLQEANNNLLILKANYAQQLYSTGLQERSLALQEQESAASQALQKKQLSLDTLKTIADIPQGQKVTIDGITYEGLSPESVDASLLETSYDDDGYLTLLIN